MLETTLESVERYIREHKEHKPLLESYDKVVRAYETFLRDHPEPPGRPGGQEVQVDDLATILNREELLEVVNALAGALRDDSASQTIVKHMTRAENPVENLLEFWSNPEGCVSSTAKALKLSDEEVHLFLLLVIKPFFFRVCPENPPSDWEKNHCPICGTLPHFSRFEKEVGKRFVACPVCETQWPFPRFACPFCGEKAKEQTYMTAEEYSYFRVYLCGSCKSYIKTAVEKELDEPVHPFLEDLVTTPLDEAAIHEGYQRDPGYFKYAKGDTEPNSSD